MAPDDEIVRLFATAHDAYGEYTQHRDLDPADPDPRDPLQAVVWVPAQRGLEALCELARRDLSRTNETIYAMEPSVRSFAFAYAVAELSKTDWPALGS
jgi:hypothetical protein